MLETVEIDAQLDLFAEIEKLKKEKKRGNTGALLPSGRYSGCCRLHWR